MKLRITFLLVFALVAIGCAGPDLSDGVDVNDGSEQVANDDTQQEASSPPAPAPDMPSASEEPSDDPNGSASNDAVREDAAPEPEGTESTAPALETSPTVEKSTPSPSAPAPAPEETPPPAVVESDAVGKAKADLAARLGVAADSIEVVSVQEVDWPDTSIGCPQPDMVYAQVITNGSGIILSHNGGSYSYHSAAMGEPFYCENPTDPVPGSDV